MEEEIMRRSLPVLSRIVVTVVIAATVAAGFASVAHADEWARDKVAAKAFSSLDPAVRTAIAARSFDVEAAPVDAPTPALDEGFAWGAAALGVGVGIAAMCALFGCVTLVRSDGRLRNA
jgi:hypothetical protein